MNITCLLRTTYLVILESWGIVRLMTVLYNNKDIVGEGIWQHMFCKFESIIIEGHSPTSVDEDGVDELCRRVQDLINQVPKGSNAKI